MLHLAFQIILRTIALAGSIVLFAALVLAFLIANINSFTPYLLAQAAERSDGELSFESVRLGLSGTSPEFQVNGLELGRQLENGPFSFTADSIQVSLATPAITSGGLRFERIGVDNPEVKASFSADIDQEREAPKRTGDRSFGTGNALLLLSTLKTLDVNNGKFNLILDSKDVDINALGQFSLDGNFSDDVFSAKGEFVSSLHNESTISYTINVVESSGQSAVSEIEVNVESLDAAWLAAIWAIVGNEKRQLNPALVTAVIDAKMMGRLVDEDIETIDWELTIIDPDLDGLIPDSKRTVFSSTGNWSADETGSKKINSKLELTNLDMRVLLDKYPTMFPPKFYRHMTERLNSLWVRKVSGEYSGDPLKAIQDKDLSGLNINGNVQNMNFIYGKNWPELVDGSAEFTVVGNRFDLTGTHGEIQGQKVGQVTSYIEDLMVPDPIMYLSAQIDAPMPLVFELFGPNGTVLPGKTKGITRAVGTGGVSMTVSVPLRRGKEYSIDGVAVPGDISVVTEYGPEVTQISGQVNFDQVGILSGNIKATALGGEVEVDLTGSGTKGNYVVSGSASGNSQAEELESIFGSAFGSNLSGTFNWDANFEFEPQENNIEFTSSLEGLESTLPYPLSKPAQFPIRLYTVISTKNGTERQYDFDLASLVQGSLQSTLVNRTWRVHTGSVAIGNVGRPEQADPGVHVVMSLPEFDYDQWSHLLSNSEAETKLQIDDLRTFTASIDTAILARDRQLNSVSAKVTKEEEDWHIHFESDEVVGTATFKQSDDPLQESPSQLIARLSKCHVPEAQSDPIERSVNPRNMPDLDLECSDMRYGQYHLGNSVIQAKASEDGWKITKANFVTPALTIDATGDWFYEGRSAVKFKFTSDDLGSSMNQLGYTGLFESGSISLTGYLNWNEALTKWEPALTSGEIGFLARDGTVKNVADNPSTTLVGLFNYETLLQRMSVDVADVLKGGIAYHNLAGKMTVSNGIIHVDGIQLTSPSVDMVIQGSTNWINKEHDLIAGVDSNIGKSVTTITTLINPLQGLFSYIAQEILEDMDLNLFSLQYQIGGTWEDPVIKRAGVSG